MRNKKRESSWLLSVVLVAMMVTLLLLGLVCGSVQIPLRDTLAVLLRTDTNSKNALIIWSVRLPRVLAGLLSGFGLGVAGVLLQGIMNNALASPNTIGVNSGAGFFVMLSMILFPRMLVVRAGLAFLGALITSVIILLLAYVAEKSRITIVLAGIAISSILSAGMNMLRILDPDISINALQFLIGSLSGVTLTNLRYPAIGIIVSLLVAASLAKALNLLELGDGVASSLGLRVNLFRGIFIVLASILAGSVVSFSGLIGFVGLIVPHICRYLFGHDARVLIPTAALTGAILVLFADLIGRILFAPYEIPVGIILSLTGGPFFLYLLMKKGGRRINA